MAKSKGVAFDEVFDLEKELARRNKQYKIKRKPNTKMFKLRDPKTGLFLAMNAYHSEARFNTNGVSWGSRKAAMRNWEHYEFNRAYKNPAWAALELVEFRVTVDEQGKDTKSPSMSLSGMYCRVAHFDYNHKVRLEVPEKKPQVISRMMAVFVQYLQNEKPDFKFTHLIELEASVEMDTTPLEHLPFLSGTNLSTYKGANSINSYYTLRFASEGSTSYFIAVNSDRDFIFVKVGYSEYIIAICENREIIRRYDDIVKMAPPNDL